MSESCDQCGKKEGAFRGDGFDGDRMLVCDECWDRMIEDGMVLPRFDGGHAFHDEVQEHPLMVGRYTENPLDILFAAMPSDRTSAGTVRVLERGQGAGKLGIKSLIETCYVSRFAPLEVPEPWEEEVTYDLPGMFELTQATGSNDKVWREILSRVEMRLSDGLWVVLVASPRQWAYEVRVFIRKGKES